MESTSGRRIKELRKAKGMSVEALADKLDVKPTAIYGLEKDANKPSFDTINALLETFPDVNPDWLIRGEGPMLRDGKTLTPVVAEERTPARPMAAVQESTEVIYLKQQLDRKDQQMGWMQDMIDRLLQQVPAAVKEAQGKLLSNDYAAVEMAAPGFKFGQPKSEVKVLGDLLPMGVEGRMYYTNDKGELIALNMDAIRPVVAITPKQKEAA